MIAVENAIASWVEASTGLPAYWSNQDAPRPSGAYVQLTATATAICRPWVDTSDNPTPSVGQEIIHTARHVERIDLTIQVFNNSAIGNFSGSSLLANLMLASQLPTRQAAFRVAGWAPASFGSVQDISAPRGGAIFEPRTRLTCYGYTAPELSEAGTYIQIVDYSGLSSGTIDTGTPDITPPVVFYLLTEAGESIITEGGEGIIVTGTPDVVHYLITEAGQGLITEAGQGLIASE